MRLYSALTRGLEDVREILAEHQEVLRRIGEGEDEHGLERCPIDCPHRTKLREVLLETIERLEESRKSFKSRQLEELRKKLIRILAEDR